VSAGDTIKIRVVVVTDGKRWIAHGESGETDSCSLQFMEIECDPQWRTQLDRDMICIVEADIPYKPNRVQIIEGHITARGESGR
jgi:hypothetical protein